MSLRMLSRCRNLLCESLKYAKTISSITLRTRHFSSISQNTPSPTPFSGLSNIFLSKPVLTCPSSVLTWNTVLKTNRSDSLSSVFMFRRFSTFLGSNSSLMKVVCTMDLNAMSVEQYEDACRRVCWRFPLVDRAGGLTMRRTVRSGEYVDYSRSFLFEKVCFGEVGPCYLLICTETMELAGIKGVDKLVLIKEGLFAKKELVAKVTGVTTHQVVCLAGLNLPAESIYAKDPCRDICNAAVLVLMELLENNDCDLPDYKLLYFGEWLAFVYALCFKGCAFAWTRDAVKRNVARQDVLEIGTGLLPLNNLVSKDQWEEMSNGWNLGAKKWIIEGDLEINIEEELNIVKAAPVLEVESNTKFNDTRLDTSLAKLKKECEAKFKASLIGLGDFVKLAAYDAWNASLDGFDEEEYFDEAKFWGTEEVVNRARKEAKRAWEEANDLKMRLTPPLSRR